MALPTITSFTPTSTTSGTLVTIIGTNFANITAVRFGGIPAGAYTVINTTTISALVGSGATGSITVTNADGTGTRTGFTFVSNSCGCPELPSSCIPQPLIPVCDDPEYCEDIFNDKCIIHTSNDLVNIGAISGDRLNTILLKIDTLLGTLI